MTALKRVLTRIEKSILKENSFNKEHIDGVHLLFDSSTAIVHPNGNSGKRSVTLPIELKTLDFYKEELNNSKGFKLTHEGLAGPGFSSVVHYESSKFIIHVFKGDHTLNDFIRIFYKQKQISKCV